MITDAEALGAELRAARESRELTLEQAEQQTRIRAHYLTALEEGSYSALPSAVQGRGFLRNYARFLGLDGDVFASRFDASLRGGSRRGRRPAPVFADDPTLQSASRRTISRESPVPAAPVSGKPKAKNSDQVLAAPRSPNVRSATGSAESRPSRGESRQNRTRNMTLGTLAIIAVSVIVLIILIVYSMQTAGTQNGSSPILSPLPSQITLTDTPAPTNTPVVIPTTAPQNTNGPSAAGKGTATQVGGLRLQVTIHERSYIRITVDDSVVYAGAAAPDTVLQYTAKNTIGLHTGDAGGIDVTVNDILQPTLGQRHEIKDVTYSANAPPTTPRPGKTPTLDPNAAIPSRNQLNSSPASPLAALLFTATVAATGTTAATDIPILATSSLAAISVPDRTPSSIPQATRVTPTSTPSVFPTQTPTATRTPTIPPTATESSTPTTNSPAIFLPHQTLTPESRAN